MNICFVIYEMEALEHIVFVETSSAGIKTGAVRNIYNNILILFHGTKIVIKKENVIAINIYKYG